VVLKGIADWMDVNKEAIFDTRPWKVFGEGPASAAAPAAVGNFTEGKGKPFTAQDVRFTTKGDTLYAIVLGAPKKDLLINSLGAAGKLSGQKIRKVTLLGSKEKLTWSQAPDALTIKAPEKIPNDIANVYKISL
jgi:alpha-L-fucosidase